PRTSGRITIPAVAGSSGSAANAAKRLPSRASSTSSSCDSAAPEMTGIGGSESVSKHTGAEVTSLSAHRRGARVVHEVAAPHEREAEHRAGEGHDRRDEQDLVQSR